MDSISLFGRIPKLLKFGAIFLAIIALDQFTKSAASQPILNSGFFLGSLEWASPFFRVFCTLALLALSVLVLSLIQFLTWQSFPLLTLSLTVLEASLVGNGIDRLRFGGVRDFIPVQGFGHTFTMNVADVFQWLSFAFILGLIWLKPHQIWPKDNLRNRTLVFPASQLRMTAVLILITSLIAIGNFLLLTGYLKSNAIGFDFRELSICFILFLVFTWVVVFIFGVRWSLRIYGPFRAVERYLRLRNAGGEIKLRAADENEVVRSVIALLKKES